MSQGQGVTSKQLRIFLHSKFYNKHHARTNVQGSGFRVEDGGGHCDDDVCSFMQIFDNPKKTHQPRTGCKFKTIENIPA